MGENRANIYVCTGELYPCPVTGGRFTRTQSLPGIERGP